MISRHVEQRPEANSRAKEVRALRNDRANEQAGIRAAANSNTARCGTILPDKPFGGRDKVVEGVLTPFARGSLMPLLAEFRAATEGGGTANKRPCSIKKVANAVNRVLRTYRSHHTPLGMLGEVRNVRGPFWRRAKAAPTPLFGRVN